MKDFAKRFGERYHQLRMERGLSAKELAALLGSNYRTTIYHLESGRKFPSFPWLLRSAELLGADELDFFTFPDADLRHELIELMRHAPDEVLLETKQFLEARLAEALEGRTAQARRR